VHKVLSLTIMVWGIVTASTAAIQTRVQLIALRTLLGLFEASIIASLIMITSAWYKRREGAARFGIWWSGLGLAQIVGGLVSFAAQHSSSKIQGWRLMFLVIGLVNILVAAVIFRLPAGPEEATWLRNSEKETAVRRLKEDYAGTGAKVLRTRSVIEVVLDLQTWLLCTISVLSMFASGVIALYSSTLIANFGYKPKMAALLNMPSGVVSIIACISCTFIVARGYPRWAGIMIAASLASLGALLLVVLPASNQVGLLVGVYLVNAGPGAFTLVLSTTASNYRGYTRKVCFEASHVSALLMYSRSPLVR
jgi:MFS family permease